MALWAASMWGVAETATVSLGSKTRIASLDNDPGSKTLHSYPLTSGPGPTLQLGQEPLTRRCRTPESLRPADSERAGDVVERLPLRPHFENAPISRQRRC